MPPAAAKRAQAAHHGEEVHSSVTVGTVTTRLTVTVPAGISGGDLVRVAAPDGSYHSIMVPGGLTSGQQFSVELLAAGSAAGTELQRLKVSADGRPHIFLLRSFFRLFLFSLSPLSPLASLFSSLSQMELDAERALRRETQQEALRSRSVRAPSLLTPPHVFPPPSNVTTVGATPGQALDALQIKRAADQAYFRDVIKRQRRCLDLLHETA